MTFAEELQDEAGIPGDHPLKSGCFGSFLLGVLFSILFLITVFIKPNQSNIISKNWRNGWGSHGNGVGSIFTTQTEKLQPLLSFLLGDTVNPDLGWSPPVSE